MHRHEPYLIMSSLAEWFIDFERKWHVYTYNLIISYLIFMKLNRIDHTLMEMNPIYYDEVIMTFSLH